MSKFIGIDYGTKRIGLALADEDTRIATPHKVIDNDDEVISRLVDLCQKESVHAAVLGESKKLSGEDNPVMKQIRSFKREFEEQANLPVVYIPEFFTSAQARRQPESQFKVDGSAAAIILQSYLDTESHADRN